jgi:hypothetical protein
VPPDFHHFANWSSQWAKMPSFMLGELLFIASAGVALWHASRRGRDHQLVWLAALVAGTANDFIFMTLPLVDNFWQAQGTIMLTPRMPAYIPCVYVSFMYWPTAAVRRLGLPRWSTAALTGLAACAYYASYDIVGAKFLWWTWHDTDKPIAARILGAPCSSTLWVLTFAGAFAWLVDQTLRGRTVVDGRAFVVGLAKVAGLTTFLMMVQMSVLQRVDGGTPGVHSLGVGLAGYALIAAIGLRRRDPRPLDDIDRVAQWMAATHFVAIAAIGLSFDPATHVSVGLHQPVGPCHVEATDITGLTRFANFCVDDFAEEFSFRCVDAPPADGATWYTICGTPLGNPTGWRTGLIAIALLGAALFRSLWVASPASRSVHAIN